MGGRKKWVCYSVRVFYSEVMSAVNELREIVAKLRGPGGCPWDQEQDHQSLRICLIEECCELIDTIDRMDMDHMREELGDVLLQVLFHAQLAEEAGLFDLEAVAKDINEKLIRRHPHVFGENKLSTSDEVLVQWDEIKQSEKKNGTQSDGLFKELPPILPALLRTMEIIKQIDKKELKVEGAFNEEKVDEIAVNLTAEEAGRRLFEVAAACRSAGIDPESALRDYTKKITTVIEEHHQSG